MKMVPKAKKEAPAPLEAKAKAKALKAKKVLEGIHSHTHKKSHTSPTSLWLQRQLSILGREPPGETSLTTVPSPSSP